MAIISLHVNVKTPFHLVLHYRRAIDQPCWGGGAKKKWGGLPPLPHAGYGPAVLTITKIDVNYHYR